MSKPSPVSVPTPRVAPGAVPRLAFPVCFEKTIFYKRLADRLGATPEECFWISTSRRWSAWLERDGVPRRNILLISRSDARRGPLRSTASERVARIEADGAIRLAQVASSDRVLSGWQYEDAQRYLAYVVDQVWSFLEAHDVRVIFGEMTSHLEFLTAAVAKQQSRMYFVPESVRSPSIRFLFFRWNSFKEYYRFRHPVHSDPEALTRDAIHALVKKKQRPHYWFETARAQRLNLKFLYHSLSRFREALADAEDDALVWTLRDRLLRHRKYLAPFRNFYLRISAFFERPPQGERFVLFPLHRQPEASVDAAAPRWQNQVETVRALALELPYGTRLYVKEHFSALGERPMGRLRAMKRIPGVRLVDPRIDTYELMEKADVVVTIAGTSSLEATILGTKAITLAPVFFNHLPSLECAETGREIGDVFRRREKLRPGLEDERDLAAYQDILSNSFEGIISDPLNSPSCIEEPNLTAVSSAFRALFADLEREAGSAVRTDVPAPNPTVGRAAEPA